MNGDPVKDEYFSYLNYYRTRLDIHQLTVDFNRQFRQDFTTDKIHQYLKDSWALEHEWAKLAEGYSWYGSGINTMTDLPPVQRKKPNREYSGEEKAYLAFSSTRYTDSEAAERFNRQFNVGETVNTIKDLLNELTQDEKDHLKLAAMGFGWFADHLSIQAAASKLSSSWTLEQRSFLLVQQERGLPKADVVAKYNSIFIPRRDWLQLKGCLTQSSRDANTRQILLGAAHHYRWWTPDSRPAASRVARNEKMIRRQAAKSRLQAKKKEIKQMRAELESDNANTRDSGLNR